MNDAINRAVERRAWQIVRIEQWLVVASVAFMLITLAASLYFEQSYGVPPWSLAIAVLILAASVACFWALFGRFGGGFRSRSEAKGTRVMFWLASLYMVVVSLIAYVVTFGLFGLQTPWTGPGRENLYLCYFLLAVAAVFLARSVTFYWRLRSYIVQSLGNLSR